MVHYIEGIEKILELDVPGAILTIVRRHKEIEKRKVYALSFVYTFENGNIVDNSFLFKSLRGRDTAYSELITCLGRTPLINIARYQHWDDREG